MEVTQRVQNSRCGPLSVKPSSIASGLALNGLGLNSVVFCSPATSDSSSVVFHGKPSSWQEVKALTSKQNAVRIARRVVFLFLLESRSVFERQSGSGPQLPLTYFHFCDLHHATQAWVNTIQCLVRSLIIRGMAIPVHSKQRNRSVDHGTDDPANPCWSKVLPFRVKPAWRASTRKTVPLKSSTTVLHTFPLCTSRREEDTHFKLAVMWPDI